MIQFSAQFKGTLSCDYAEGEFAGGEKSPTRILEGVIREHGLSKPTKNSESKILNPKF